MLRRLTWSLLAFLLLLAAGSGALLWRLEQGPISLAPLQPVLRPLVDRGLPFRVTYADPTLVWLRGEGAVAVEVRDLEVRTPDGELVGGAPRARAVVAAAPLLQRRIEPEVVQLDLPELELTREPDGRLVLGFAGEIAAVDLTGGRLAALLDRGGGAVAAGGGRADLDELRSVRVTAPALVYTDATTGRATTASDARVELRRDDGGEWKGILAARLGDGRLRAEARAGGPAGGREVLVQVDRFPLQSLQALLPDLPRLRLDLPVTGEIAFALPPGELRPGPAELRLRTEDALLAAPAIGLDPVPIERGALRARLEPGWRAGRIERLELAGGGYTVEAAGTASIEGPRPRLDLELRARDLGRDEVLALWPKAVAAGARRWVEANVAAGSVGAATLHLGAAAARPDQRDLAGTFAFSGAEVRYLQGLPAATGVSGRARFAGDSFGVTLEAGGSGGVNLERGEVELTNLVGAEHPRLAATLELASAVPAALALLDHEPFALGRRAGLRADGAAGRQATSLELSLPILDPLPKERVRYRARTRLTGLRLPEVRPGYGIAADAARLEVTPDGLAASSDEVRVNGVPFAATWREGFGDGAAARREVAAKGRLDAAGAAALRLEWPAILSGGVGVDLELAEARRAPRRVDLRLDLRDAGVTLPALLLAKPPGQPGSASARIVQADESSATVEDLRVNAGSLALEGSLGLRLTPGLALERLRLARATTPLGSLSADLARQGDAWRGRIDAGEVDLRPLRQDWGSRDEGSSSPRIPDFAVELTARSLRLGDVPLTGLRGSVERRRGVWQAARLRVGIEDSQVTLDLATAARTTLTLSASDAGWLIRAFAASDNGVRGGRLRLDADLAQTPRGAAGTGEFAIRDFTLYGAPLIARIVSLASFSGLANALSGKGVPVTRLVIPFALDRDRLTLTEARLVAADIGARADGTVDLGAGTLAVDGTVAPAYTVNRILGSIPILGQILSGSGSDAALAATFAIRGTLADPQVTVNPLSVLVPGMIRDLFAALTKDAGEDGAAPPASRR